MQSSQFTANYPDDAEELTKYLENSKTYLGTALASKLNKDKNLDQQLQFGENDDEQAEKSLSQLLEGLTCQDLSQLFDCNSFTP